MQDKESHAKPIEEIVSGFQTHLDQGLTKREAQDRFLAMADEQIAAEAIRAVRSLIIESF